MKTLIESLYHSNPQHVAIETANEKVSYAELCERLELLGHWLVAHKVKSVALQAQNSVDWIVIDLACQALELIFTPIPLFFSQEQVERVLSSVKPDILFGDNEPQLELQLTCDAFSLKGRRLTYNNSISAPLGTTKITYTSGSTGVPKGVCLSNENQLKVAKSLVEVIAIERPKHLCLLPLPTLLENIAGVYAPLLANGTVVIASDEERGFDGSKLVNPHKLISCITQHSPQTLILVPELLQVLLIAATKGWKPPTSLKFIAVGGSRVSSTLIEGARKLNLPVFQGYGLSECASVVSLCSVDDDITSAGRLLPHITASTVNNELVVSGNSFLGYLEDPSSWGQNEVHTGDIGRLKGDVLFIEGRIKNTIINSYGRNISPEWIESELLATGIFSQAVVIGDAKPFCTALLVPMAHDLTEEVISSKVQQLNLGLPDYAQVKHPIILQTPMSVDDGLYTKNLRPRRTSIHQHFQNEIERVYSHTQV